MLSKESTAQRPSLYSLFPRVAIRKMLKKTCKSILLVLGLCWRHLCVKKTILNYYLIELHKKGIKLTLLILKLNKLRQESMVTMDTTPTEARILQIQ